MINKTVKRRISYYAGIFVLFFSTSLTVQARDKIRPVKKLIERVLHTSEKQLPVSLKLKASRQDSTYYSYQVKNGKLHIEGNTPVSLCRGLYDFLKQEECGVYSWSGSNLHFPEHLNPQISQKVVSPFAQPLLLQRMHLWVLYALLELGALGKGNRLDGLARNQYAFGSSRL